MSIHKDTTDNTQQPARDTQNHTSSQLFNDAYGSRSFNDTSTDSKPAGAAQGAGGDQATTAKPEAAAKNEKLGLPNLEIVDGAGPKENGGDRTAGGKNDAVQAAQKTLGDANASAQEKLHAASGLADAGIKNVQVTDQNGKEHNYSIEKSKAGQNNLVHMYDKGADGKDHIALRGVEHADGSISKQKDGRGREVSFEGAKHSAAHNSSGERVHSRHQEVKPAEQARPEQSQTRPAEQPKPAEQAKPTEQPKADNQKDPFEGTRITSEHTAKATGYYPANNRMEGGFKDMKGQPLHTLQQYLDGKAPYVSVAMDNKAGIPYGQKVNIPEMNQKYGQNIPFRVVDTGSAFHGKGTSRVDICTGSKQHSLDSHVNGKLTLQFVK